MTDKQVLHWLSQQHLCFSQTSRSREAQFDWWLTSFRLKSRETTQLLIRDAFVPYRCWMIAAGLGATCIQQSKTTSIPSLIQAHKEAETSTRSPHGHSTGQTQAHALFTQTVSELLLDAWSKNEDFTRQSDPVDATTWSATCVTCCRQREETLCALCVCCFQINEIWRVIPLFSSPTLLYTRRKNDWNLDKISPRAWGEARGDYSCDLLFFR